MHAVLEELVGAGRTAEVFKWGEDKVIKLYFESIDPDWFEDEVDISHLVQDVGLPVPIMYGTEYIDGRNGIIYENLTGDSMLDLLGKKPWQAAKLARQLAELHCRVHQIHAPDSFQTIADWARGGIEETEFLSEELRARVINLLDSLPLGDRLCHCDFHPGNIFMTDRGFVIIDWMTASIGSPIGDVARTSVIFSAMQPPEGTPMKWLLDRIRNVLHDTYLKTYFQMSNSDTSNFPAWRAVMAASLMCVSTAAEAETLRQIVLDGLPGKESLSQTKN